MISAISPQEAAKAAEKILGYYPEIPASDPQGFAAGLVQTLSIFPRAVIDLAVDPVAGIPAKVKFLNLATMRELLDRWADEYHATEKRRELASRKAIEPPPRDPQAEKRISEGFKKLSEHLERGFSPSTQ